jgi:hypothetical protein
LHYVVTIAAILIAATALFGWGRVVRQLTGLTTGSWPVTIGIGLGVVIFLGGLCNLIGIARPSAFNAMILLGLALAALELRNKPLAQFSWLRIKERAHWSHALLLVIVVAVGGFVMSTELVPATFNHHDDFEKYIPQVVRMLATGTLHDNPIGSVGIETFGGQAILQGFIVANFSIAYINGADALFCLLLSLLIVGSAAFERPRLGLSMLSGVLAVVAVDPHYVNISGVYSLVALSLTLVFVSVEAPKSDSSHAHLEAIVGLLYAAQIAVKLTAITFLGLNFIFWIGGIAWICRDWRLAFWRGLKTALWSAVFLAPWIALVAPDYIAVLSPPPGSPVLPQTPQYPPAFADPFSTAPYLPLAWYSAVAAIVLCYGCGVFLYGRRLTPRDPSRERAAAFAAFCIAAAVNYIFCMTYLGPYQLDAEAATRYAVPWLIAGIGAALSLAPVFSDDTGERAPWKMIVTSLCLGLAVVLMFGPLLQQRISYAALYGMPQAYLRGTQLEARQNEAKGIAEILYGDAREQVRNAQNTVPAGAPILAWMVTPFLLDYQRNPIYEIGWYQLIRPWTLIPSTNYILWQYGGFAIRQPRYYADQIQNGPAMLAHASIGALKFGDLLQQVGHRSEVLYNDNKIVVLHVNCPQGLAQC